MNIYARFFDQDILVHQPEEVIEFLKGIPEIAVTKELESDIRAYLDSDIPYPKRYKIRPRVYFILIKTTAETMEEFRANRKVAEKSEPTEQLSRKDQRLNQLNEQKQGWYHARITFKRVLPIPGTNKFQYQDTPFEAYIKAQSGQECYARIIDYLKERSDIDMRSQFPSAKGSSFNFEYVGEQLPQNDATAIDAAEQTL